MAFIPLYDGNPLRYIKRPYVAWGLIAANLLVYFLVEAGGFMDGGDGAIQVTLGVIPGVFNGYFERPAEYLLVPEWLTLFTYAFLHGDIWHIAGNMVFLWVFADNVEDALGHVRFLIFYLLCAAAGGYVYVLSDGASTVPVVGASGAVAGVVAAYFMLHPYQRVWILLLARIPLRLNALWVLGFWILFQVYSVLASSGEDRVAWWAHIGGLVAGALLVLVLRRRGVGLFTRPLAPAIPPPHARSETPAPWGQS